MLQGCVKPMGEFSVSIEKRSCCVLFQISTIHILLQLLKMIPHILVMHLL